MGGGEERAVAGTFSLAAHLPPLFPPAGPTIPRRGFQNLFEQAESFKKNSNLGDDRRDNNKNFNIHFLLLKKIVFLQTKKTPQMDLTFADKNLKKCALDQRKCQKEMGKQRAELYLRRIADLDAANTLEDVKYLPGHYHELTQDKKGKWACDLDQPYRLVFKPHEDPIPEDENHKYIWAEILGVEIIEIVNYHKEK